MSRSAKAKMADKSSDSIYPSRFGSHKSMVDERATAALEGLKETEVVLKDSTGYYVTEKSNLDNGLTDWNRMGKESRERCEGIKIENPKEQATA